MPKPYAWTSLLGVIAVTAWVLLFAAGAMIDTSGYRRVLDPSAEFRKTGASTRPADGVTLRAIGENFIQAALFYMPVNAAILSLLAGLIGGCASNLVISREQLQSLESQGIHKYTEVADLLKRRLAYMAESPYISMFRGFVVYLALLAGVLVISDPFADPSPTAYIKFAGTVSLIAFAMGYDPTRFSELINRIPVLGPTGAAGAVNAGVVKGQVIKAESKQDTVEITTTVGTTALPTDAPAKLADPSDPNETVRHS